MKSFKKRLIQVLLIVACGGNSFYVYSQPAQWADSCIASSFIATLTPSPANLGFAQFNNVHECPDGDIVATGFIRMPVTSGVPDKVYAVVMRISTTGQLRWIKYIGDTDPTRSSDTRVYASTLASNEDIVVYTGSQTGTEPGNAVLRLDRNGNTIWKKHMHSYFSAELYEQIIETSDGGFLLGGVGSSNALVVKLNSQGDLVWRRGFASTFYVNCRSIAESPTAYYFTGYSYTSNASESVLAQLNKTDGSIIWARGFGSALQATGGSEYGYDRMLFKDNLLYLHGSTRVNFSGPNKPASHVIAFNETGTIVLSRRIENASPTASMYPSSLFRKRTYDPVTHSGLQYDGTDTSDFYVYHLNQQYSPVWAWRLPFAGFEWAQDMEVLRDSSLVICGTNNLSVGASYIQRGMILKTTAAGRFENCNNVPAQFIVGDPSFANGNSPISGSLLPEPNTPSLLSVFDGHTYEWILHCASTMPVRLSPINGPDTICVNNTYLYKVTRSGNSLSSVIFSSPDAGVLIQIVSDTSVNISFNTTGIKRIIAAMPSPCGTLKDTIDVNVVQQEPAVNLGNDLYLCQSSVTLHAGPGYKSYLWNNGSADSVLTVAATGTYYVTVNDYCNTASTDTIHILAAPQINYSIGNDTSICKPDTMRITAPGGFSNYHWSSSYNTIPVNDSIILVFPFIDTFYVSTAENFPGCILTDTIKIHVNAPSYLTAGADTSFCRGKSFHLTATPGFSFYLWNNGTTNSSLLVQQPGIYSILTTDLNGCKSRDTVIVTVNDNPVPLIAGYTNICINAPRVLSLTAPFAGYLWQNNSTNPTYSVTDTGWYSVEVTDMNGCKGTDSVHLIEFVQAPSAFLSPDTTICYFDEISLKANQDYINYNWNTGSASPSIKTTQEGIYWLEVHDQNNCTGRDSIGIGYKDCKQALIFPNAFSPNNDGLNDVFGPKVWGQIENYNLKIYNRWGQKIFETNTISKGWDGMNLSVSQPTAVFVYMCNYKFKNETARFVKGSFTLIR